MKMEQNASNIMFPCLFFFYPSVFYWKNYFMFNTPAYDKNDGSWCGWCFILYVAD